MCVSLLSCGESREEEKSEEFDFERAIYIRRQKRFGFHQHKCDDESVLILLLLLFFCG